MDLYNLQSIFKEKFFRIPDYQRGYSWEKPQFEDLWRDVNALGDDERHYTGMLFVRPDTALRNLAREDSVIPKNNRMFIVDGQQRITTLIILINVILNAASVKKAKQINGKSIDAYREKYLYATKGAQGKIFVPIFSYDKDNPSYVYFKKEILGMEDMDSGVRTLYTQNLQAAHKFFVNKVKKMSFEEVESVLRKVTEQLKFNYYQIDNELNEFVAFETINNRGKQLSTLELLKNRLIYLSTLLPKKYGDAEKDILRGDINKAWKIVYQYLGQGERLDDDKFLNTHWIMMFGYKGRSKAKVYKEDLLNHIFTADNVRSEKITFSDIQDYAQDIQKAVKPYFFLHDPEHSDCPYSDDVKYWLSKMYRLDYGLFDALNTAMLINHADNPAVVDVLKAAERFCFVTFRVHGYQSNKKNSEIYRCATGLHKGGWTMDEVEKYLSLDALGISAEKSQSSFYDAIMDKYWKGFYEWRGLHYFLYEYEVDLQEKERGEAKLKWEDINSETIEHIYPQTPVPGWGKFFRKNSDKELAHGLGNLLLLSQSKNSKVGNGLFSEKRKVFSTNSYSAIEVSRCSEWTPEVVKKRREKMLKFLWRRWGLQEPKE